MFCQEVLCATSGASFDGRKVANPPVLGLLMMVAIFKEQSFSGKLLPTIDAQKRAHTLNNRLHAEAGVSSNLTDPCTPITSDSLSKFLSGLPKLSQKFGVASCVST